MSLESRSNFKSFSKNFKAYIIIKTFAVLAEAVTGGVLQEKVFLEIWQNSQEITCARVSFLITLQASGLQLY